MKIEERDPNRPGAEGLVSGRRLAHNALLNLAGHGAPVVVAIFAIPLLIEGLGTDRFGVLTLAWMVIGYFSLFDLGLSRALTQLVAERIGRGAHEEIPPISWTALLLMLGLGSMGGLLLAGLSPWLVRQVLSVPTALQEETQTSLYLLAFSLPWVITTAGLRGLLEASQRFGLVNALRLPMGIFTFAGPLLVLPFGRSLALATAVLVAGRMVAWVAHVVCCLKVLPELKMRAGGRLALVGPLVRSGGWMTVSNVVSPLMVYFDRFLIASLLSLSAVAYYVTPYELVVKLWLIPSALLGVFFPAFALVSSRDRERLAVLFERVLRALLLVLFPICLVLVVGAHEGLELWLGKEFAAESTLVLQWLSVGVFVNGLAHAPFALVQGIGRPDFTGKLHLIELPFYALALWWLTREFGIVGASIAWTARVAVDAVVLLIVAVRVLGPSHAGLRRTLRYSSAAAVVLLAAILPANPSIKVALLAVVLPAFVLVGWGRLLSPAERLWIRNGARPPKGEPASMAR